MADTSKSSPAANSPVSDRSYVIVDLGRKSRSEIRGLRKGEGKLFAKVEEITTQLKTDRIEGQPVFVVQEKLREVLW
jgi:hypothetical protein